MDKGGTSFEEVEGGGGGRIGSPLFLFIGLMVLVGVAYHGDFSFSFDWEWGKYQREK